jgi:diguanylate cyclase
MNDQDDISRTLGYADTAMGQIRALKQAASPRNFEIWYTYATGYNQALNQDINETLVREGHISEADLARVYDKHLSPIRLS